MTLTYNDEYLPRDNSLKRGEILEFLAKLRSFYPEGRYYLIGEYGPLRLRPHYHALFFGRSLQKMALECIWPKGFVDSSPFSIATACYVAGYVTDKLKHDRYPEGLEPPFSLMSQHPGLGSSAIPYLTKFVKSEFGQKYLAENKDVPTYVKFDGRMWPIGRYLAGKLREAVGLENAAERTQRALDEQKLIENTPELYDEREARRQVAKDRAAALHRRRRVKLRL